jgi:5-methylcytosine-specific restriction endonuclease McrA
MAARARNRLSTTARGLGAFHQADKKRLLAAHRDGDPCWRCGQPMYKTQALERDHLTARALGGTDGHAVLAHARCNRSAGAKLGNRMRGQRRAAAKAARPSARAVTYSVPLRTSRNW